MAIVILEGKKEYLEKALDFFKKRWKREGKKYIIKKSVRGLKKIKNCIVVLKDSDLYVNELIEKETFIEILKSRPKGRSIILLCKDSDYIKKVIPYDFYAFAKKDGITFFSFVPELEVIKKVSFS